MKVSILKLYITKLSSLANKFHRGEANLQDIVQLRLLINAFHIYIKKHNINTEVYGRLLSTGK